MALVRALPLKRLDSAITRSKLILVAGASRLQRGEDAVAGTTDPFFGSGILTIKLQFDWGGVAETRSLHVVRGVRTEL